MKERPILFSGPMVQAILEGRKTQTRRIVKPQPTGVISATANGAPVNATIDPAIQAEERGCPYGQPGDRLWVRETHKLQDVLPHGFLQRLVAYKDGTVLICDPKEGDCVRHLSDDERHMKIFHPRWRPSIHMPRWASRITLEVVSVSVERLQDISRGDCMAEGCPFPNMAKVTDPVAWYRSLWQSINGPESWDVNPWVWVVEFKRMNQEVAAAA